MTFKLPQPELYDFLNNGIDYIITALNAFYRFASQTGVISGLT